MSRTAANVVLVMMVLASAAHAAAQEELAPGPGHPIRATAPRVGPDDLGRAYDAGFSPLRGSRAIEVESTALVVREVVETEHGYSVVQEEEELLANAGVWGLGRAGVSRTSGRMHAYFRAAQIRRVVELPLDATMSAHPPPEARYYLAAIYYGHLYEMRFSGTNDTIRAGLSAIFPGGSVDAGGGVSQSGVEFHARGIGLTPVDGRAIFASSDSEISQMYRADGEPQPIFVAYARIPGVAPVGPDRLVVRLDSVQFTRARSWDAIGGPDIRVLVEFGGATVLDYIAPRDQYEITLGGAQAVLGNGITPSADNPLRFRFWDVDISANDFAGEVFVSELSPHPEPRRFRTPNGEVTFSLGVSSTP